MTRRRLSLSILATAATACGGRDAETPLPDATADLPPDGPPACATADFDPVPAKLPPSNTLRLAGTITSTCGTIAGIEVTLDGHPLAPFADKTVPDAERLTVDAATGRWNMTANVWCWIREHGALGTGKHRLAVTPVVETDADAGAPPVVGAGRRDVAFSGASAAADLPWTPGVPGARGSEPGHEGPDVAVRDHAVDVELEGAPRTYHYQVEVFPGYHPGKPAPVVFSLHGWGHNPNDYQGFTQWTGMRGELGKRGYLGVVPNGEIWDPARTSVGAFGCLFMQCYEPKNWYAPVMSAIAEDFARRYSIDGSRVHVEGFSCGASYAYCLGMNHPGKFASAVIMDGNQQPLTYYTPTGYLPVDMTREIPMKIVTGAARKEWEYRLGPDGTARKRWCIDPAYDWSGSQNHQWFGEFDAAIADFFDANRI